MLNITGIGLSPRLTSGAGMVGAVMVLMCSGCEKQQTFEEDFSSAFRACGLLSSGRTTNFWFTDNVQLRCGYRCFMMRGCDSLLSRACGTAIPGSVLDCIDDCIPAPVDCGDGTTAAGVDVCSYFNECENGADELGCYPQFQCADGSEMVPMRFVCNDYPNCADGSDEAACTPSDFFECADGSERWSLHVVCNGHANCADGSDEIGCAQYICD